VEVGVEVENAKVPVSMLDIVNQLSRGPPYPISRDPYR
jgi:hypothetical protein